MAWLSNVLVYTGGYLFLVFIAVCLATGLYYLAEIVEEYTRVTKKVLTWAIKISAVSYTHLTLPTIYSV